MYKKSYENETDPEKKQDLFNILRSSEALREFHTGSLKPINHLIQFDQPPNQDLTEARPEIYKISVSFEYKRKIPLSMIFLVDNSNAILKILRLYQGCSFIKRL